MRAYPFGLVALAFAVLGGTTPAGDDPVNFNPADISLLGGDPEARAELKDKYDGKVIKVAGTVTAAGKDAAGHYYLVRVEGPKGKGEARKGVVRVRTEADAKALQGHEVIVRGKASVDPKAEHPLAVEAKHVQVDPGPQGQDPPVSADAPKDAVAAEMKKLEGTWAPVSLETGGEKATGDELKDLGVEKLSVKDGKATVRRDEKTFVVSLKVDPTKKPRQIDRVITEGEHKGLTTLAIYTLEGDTLTICYEAENSDRRRPRELTSRGTQVIIVFKREKP